MTTDDQHTGTWAWGWDDLFDQVHTTHPHLSEQLEQFFEAEIGNYRTAVRQGDIDPSDGYHPTLSSALDSWSQAPVDVRAEWIGFDEDDLRTITRHADGAITHPQVDAWEAMHDVVESLAWLIVLNGPDALLTTLLEENTA